MYSLTCIIGIISTLALMAGGIATFWLGLRTILANLQAQDPATLTAAGVLGLALLLLTLSSTALSIADRRRASQTLIYNIRTRQWEPANPGDLKP